MPQDSSAIAVLVAFVSFRVPDCSSRYTRLLGDFNSAGGIGRLCLFTKTGYAEVVTTAMSMQAHAV